ncbi:adenylosuccinate lyase [Micromonospora craniellae]|uniref:Adenylosuccinate lyase n=1 Tax=Micromonospora craniellae TaxID=2294034 RepID=A0A372FUC5_9ACTN|nr:adenylosuccinate lyase [Micromonospora craniellae]QOC92210.1 adenylosuccinate lyase [Micromonospora craniellae]RFS44355.1 adenylosuccinate lyase [Micromonospora craniellae]
MQLGSCFLDSLTVTSFFGNAEMRGVFNDRRLMQSWLDVEAALARAQAGLGIIPSSAAQAITDAARLDRLDTTVLAADAADTVHPLVPLVRALTAACQGDAGRYVHLGATTQDVMDTGFVLRARAGLDIVSRQVDELVRILRRLALRHRATPMAARTHGQQALPTTFGLRCAVWQSELQRHRTRLVQMRERLLVTSMGGAAGTMAGYGPQAFALERAVADELGLGVADTPWHATSDRFAECLMVLGLVASSAEKLAREIYFLGRTEVGEAHEPQRATQVGSSTMPHKRNPIRCEAVIAAAGTLRAQVPLAMQTMVAQDDRDMGVGMTLWKLLPECFILIGGALERLVEVFGDLGVDPDRMRANLDLTGGLVLSEAIMLRLAGPLGREQAHHLVMRIVRDSLAQNRPFVDVLRADPQVAAALPGPELAELLDPLSYVGHAAALVDRALLTSESP